MAVWLDGFLFHGARWDRVSLQWTAIPPPPRRPGIVVLSDQGEVLMAWGQRTPNTNRGFHVSMASLLPGAAAWTPEAVAAWSEYTANLSFAPNGDAYMIASSSLINDSSQTLYRRAAGAQEWIAVPFGRTDRTYFRLAFNAHGDVLAVWTDEFRLGFDDGGVRAEVFAATRSSASGEWGPPELVTTGEGATAPVAVRAGLGDDGLAAVVLGGPHHARFLTLRSPGVSGWSLPRPLPPEPPPPPPPPVLPGLPDDYVPPPRDRAAEPVEATSVEGPAAEPSSVPRLRATDAECATWLARAGAEHRRAAALYGIAKTTRSAAMRRSAYAGVRTRLRSRDGFLALRAASCG